MKLLIRTFIKMKNHKELKIELKIKIKEVYKYNLVNFIIKNE